MTLTEMWSVYVLGEIRCALGATCIGIKIIINFLDTTRGVFGQQPSAYTQPYWRTEKRGRASDKGDVNK